MRIVAAANGQIVERLRAHLGGRDEVLLGYLFGSRARGDDHPASDIDVAVYTCPVDQSRYPWGYVVCLVNDLIDLLHTDKVDVLWMNRAGPMVLHRVFRDGILLACRDERLRVDLVVRNFHRYQDARRLHRMYIEALYRRIDEGRFGMP